MLTNDHKREILGAIQQTAKIEANLHMDDAIIAYVEVAGKMTEKIIATLQIDKADAVELTADIVNLVKKAGEFARLKSANSVGGMQRIVFDQYFSENLKANFFPEIDNSLLTAAKADYDAKRYMEAISKLCEFVKKNPACTEATYYLAKSYYYSKKYESALIHFEALEANKSEPALADYAHYIGLCYFYKEGPDDRFLKPVVIDDTEAKLLESYLEDFCSYDNELANYNITRLYLRLAHSIKGKREDEKALFKRLYAKGQKRPEKFPEVELELLCAKSQARLKILLAIKPKCPYVQQLQGSLHEVLEEYVDAISCYSEAKKYCEPVHESLQKELSASLAKCYTKLGKLFYKEKEYITASKAFRAALKQDRTHTKARHELGACLLQLGKFDEAEQEFNTIIEEAKDLKYVISAWGGRAACLRETKKFVLAKDALMAARRLVPENETIPSIDIAMQKIETKAAIIIQQKWRFFKTSQLASSQPQEGLEPVSSENAGLEASQSAGPKCSVV